MVRMCANVSTKKETIMPFQHHPVRQPPHSHRRPAPTSLREVIR